MGNVFSGGNGGSVDEENTLAMYVARAASQGAREGVLEAFLVPRQGQQNTQGALIEGLLPVPLAQEAAATGAIRALEAMAKELNFASRFAYRLGQVKSSAGDGAKAGLDKLERMVMLPDIKEVDGMKVIALDVAAAAAATGAWTASFIAAQRNLNPNRYTTFLGPMLGGSFPSSVAVYNLIGGSSDIAKLCGFGGFTLAVFVISSGLAAGLLGGTTESAGYTRFAALAAVTIVLTLFTFGLCSLFDSPTYKTVWGTIFGILIAIFVAIWLYCEW